MNQGVDQPTLETSPPRARTWVEGLRVQGLRNLGRQEVDFGPGVNLVFGANGAGKSSLLEALHLLATGRSFRLGTQRTDRAIQQGADYLAVHGRLLRSGPGFSQSVRLGLVCYAHPRRLQAALNGRPVRAASELASAFPLSLFNSDSFQLLESGPQARRRFLDRGLFHVKPGFLDAWQGYRRALNQRNELLRRGKMSGLSAWDEQLVRLGTALDRDRRWWVDRMTPAVSAFASQFIDLDRLDLRYQSGWPETSGLGEALRGGLDADEQRGFTLRGPHRAELRILVGGRNALEVLSRGQQKLLVAALQLARQRLMQESTGNGGVLLLDDVAAEIDPRHRERLAGALAGLVHTQVIATAIDPQALDPAWFEKAGSPDLNCLHLERGDVRSGAAG